MMDLDGLRRRAEAQRLRATTEAKRRLPLSITLEAVEALTGVSVKTIQNRGGLPEPMKRHRHGRPNVYSYGELSEWWTAQKFRNCPALPDEADARALLRQLGASFPIPGGKSPDSA